MSRTALSELALRIREFMFRSLATSTGAMACRDASEEFNRLALELQARQLEHNTAYRTLYLARGMRSAAVGHWSEFHAVPVSAFKEMEMTCLPPAQRTAVFYSSGTTGRSASRHYHCTESLALYEDSLTTWFRANMAENLAEGSEQKSEKPLLFILLTPPAEQAPHSSLAHMFDTVSRTFGGPGTRGGGRVAADGSWELDMDQIESGLADAGQHGQAVMLLGTAFNYVHLLEQCAARGRRFELPAGSRLLETGGYKGRSRSLAKQDLHAQLSDLLGIPRQTIVGEYGMSELSSQAYDTAMSQLEARCPRVFRFPPWARVQVVSPESGDEVDDGETGLLRIWDLANVWSALGLQTEDMAVRRGDGFELLGRAALAEPRGCSLMAR